MTARVVVALCLLTGACGLVSSDDDAAPPTMVAPTTTTTAPAPTTTATTAAPTTAAPAPADPDFADTFAEVSTGVYRVEASYCDGNGSVGTAFLLSRTLLLTALHVTGDAAEVVISRDDGSAWDATIIGTDTPRDLALLEVTEPLPGHTFRLDDSGVRVGDEVAALGHPRALPLTFTSGRVSAIAFSDGGVDFHQTDAPVNPGNSGGPLIDEAGNVIGMADWKFIDVEGISFVVAASEIASFLESGGTRVIDATIGCDLVESDEFEAAIDDPLLAEVPGLFDEYALLINSAEEGQAYDRFAGPRLRGIVSREAFIEGNSTSILEDMTVYNVFWTGFEAAEAWVTFVSYQDPVYGPDGQSCSAWDLTYDLVLENGDWKIDRARNEPGSPAAC